MVSCLSRAYRMVAHLLATFDGDLLNHRQIGKTLNATSFGFTCWNTVGLYQPYSPQDEDCLTINVWTGAQTITDKLHVMVWIDGGGFVFGGGGEPDNK